MKEQNEHFDCLGPKQ